MSEEMFAVTLFLTVSLSLGQYIELNQPEPNHCQLKPDRRRCGPTFQPRWFFNPVEGNCFLFKYGGCQGNRNNFLSQEECLEKCSPPQQFQRGPSQGAEDEMIEAYVDRCKAPADTGPCRARKDKWYYDAGKRRCFPFIYGGCGGNSNRYGTENECMRKCAISVDRVPLPYLRGGQRSLNPSFRERILMGGLPLRRTISNPERRGAFFRTFFPLIWQVSVPNTPEPEPKIPGSPQPQDLEAMKTMPVTMSQEVTTPVKLEATQEPTTQPPKMETTNVNSILASTTAPTRLEEEEINRGNQNNIDVVAEVDSREYDEEETPELEESMETRGNVEDDEEENVGEKVEATQPENENEDLQWRRNEEVESDTKDTQDYEDEPEEKQQPENEEDQIMNTEPQTNEGYDYEDEQEKENKNIAEESRENIDPSEDEAEEEVEENEKENDTEKDMEDDKKENQRPKSPIIRFLFRTPNRLMKSFNRRPIRPVSFRRPDYRKLYRPHDMSSEDRSDKFRRFPAFNRQRSFRNWRDRSNRTPKRGITLTQVFVNKPPHPPMVNRYPIIPAPFHPYPVSPYHAPIMYRVPSMGYSRSFSIQGRQNPGYPPQFTGTYQSNQWPSSRPQSHIKVNFVPNVGEPNLACIQPPAVYRCLFGVPSTTPFWYYDARVGKCSVFYFAGCGATLNRFNSKLDCESTCMVTSPRPEITTTSEESPEQSTESPPETVEVTNDNKRTDEKTEVESTVAPEIKPETVKETELQTGGDDESDIVEGTIELSKTHKIHILHQMTGEEKLVASDQNTDLQYVMVVGIVCLSGIALLILVSLGLMYIFKRFQNTSPPKGFHLPKKESVIEAVLKSHMQVNGLPKIVCPVPLGPPQNTSL